MRSLVGGRGVVRCSGALCLTLGALVAPAVAQAAGPGQYGAAEWLPLRHDAGGGGITVGCTYQSGDGLCAGHHGYWAIDFLGSTGSPIYSAGAGLATNVTGAGYEGYGNVVVVDHGNNGRSLYAHLSEVLVDGGGRWVDQNDMIGRLGSSGGANTPHLHYEESSAGRFGSAGSRDPGPMKACRGAQTVTYPEVLGSSTWRGMSWGSGAVESDGTACTVISGVADALGASVATGVAAVAPSAPPAPEQVVAADFNGDGLADLGVRNTSTGVFSLRHGPSFASEATYPWATGGNYQAFASDFDGDRVGDIGLRETGSGMFYIKHGPAFADQVTYQWSPGPQLQVLAADFNADNKADIGLRDPATGLITMKNGPTFAGGSTHQSVAGTEHQVLAGDFNSDRMADIGLRHTGTGAIVVKMGPSYLGQLSVAAPPGAGYQAVAADFDKDGAADIGLKNAGVGVVELRHAPAYTNPVIAPLDPRLDPLVSLLGGLFAALAARSF